MAGNMSFNFLGAFNDRRKGYRLEALIEQANNYTIEKEIWSLRKEGLEEAPYNIWF